MLKLETPPGFVVRTEAEKAASDNGYRVPRGEEGGWLRFGSTTARGDIWIAGASGDGPWFLSIGHSGVAAEVPSPAGTTVSGPGVATYAFDTLVGLYATLDRVYRLAASLPDAPLERFRKQTASLPRSTEAERMVIQRIGQDMFREALLIYWGGRCPLTGITESALLRASHIRPWAECSDDERLDVHNGLLLSALWDAAFDRGLVSFTNDGTPLASRTLSRCALTALGFDTAPPLSGLREEHLRNLASHRQRHGFD